MRSCLSWKIDGVTEEAKRQASQVCLSCLTNLKRSKRCRKRRQDLILKEEDDVTRNQVKNVCTYKTKIDVKKSECKRQKQFPEAGQVTSSHDDLPLKMSHKKCGRKKGRTKNTRRWFDLWVWDVSHDKTHFMLPEVQTDKIHTTNNNFYWMKRERRERSHTERE